MRKQHNLGEICIRGSRIYLIHRMGSCIVESDITPVWHFFKQVTEFAKLSPKEKEKYEIKKPL